MVGPRGLLVYGADVGAVGETSRFLRYLSKDGNGCNARLGVRH